MLTGLHQNWQSLDPGRLEAESSRKKRELAQRLAGGGSPDLRALEELGQGMQCGAMDGALLYRAERFPPAPEFPAGPDYELLAAGLAQAVQVAHADWRHQEADNLQLLAAYGKLQNRQTGPEAMAVAAEELQVFLLATFEAGYALGLVDAAIVCVAEEEPDPVSD